MHVGSVGILTTVFIINYDKIEFRDCGKTLKMNRYSRARTYTSLIFCLRSSSHERLNYTYLNNNKNCIYIRYTGLNL